MDERGKDSRGASLIGQLLLQLAQREGFRKKLAELEERGGEAFVEKLLTEFESLVDRLYREESVERPSSPTSREPAPASREPLVPPPEPAIDATPFSAAFSPAIKDDYRIELPKLNLRISSDANKESAKKVAAPEPRAPLAPPQVPAAPKASTPKASTQTPGEQQIPPIVPGSQKPKPSEPPAQKFSASEETAPKAPPSSAAQKDSPPGQTPPVKAVKSVAVETPSKPPSPTQQPKGPLTPPSVKIPPAAPSPLRPPTALPSSATQAAGPTETAPAVVTPPKAPPAPLSSAEPPPKPPAPPPPTPASGTARPDEPATFEKPLTPTKQVHPRSVQTIEADDILYFHAIAQIPLDEKPAHQPFMMEEKGIVDKECTIAFDRGGIRFYLSRILSGSMNVSKTGVLLLGKQDSLRLRGVHYSILNDLRAHGVLLPFSFGTVAIGRENLYSVIDGHLYDLRDALEEILSTRWWNLGVFALDSKMAHSLASDLAGGTKERERRMQGTRLPVAGRLDIKTLERVLGKQKKIAESIHEELKELAVRSDVDMMVGLNSGSSDDWKPILRASYEVPLSAVHDFNRAVIDLQYRHFQHDLMFVLNGDREEFSFSDS